MWIADGKNNLLELIEKSSDLSGFASILRHEFG